MLNRPYATLFMLMSLDGKISSGDSDTLDSDKDWKRIHGVKEGLPQYYDLEKQTDFCFFQTGRVFAKIGFNERMPTKDIIPVTGVIVDNRPHLNEAGIAYLSSWLKQVIIVTTNPNHPAKVAPENVTVLFYQDTIDFPSLFQRLIKEFGIERLTIQSGGNMNAQLLRDGLIDRLSIVVAPLLVGGSTTSTLIDGEAIHEEHDLMKIKTLKFVSCNLLRDSFIHLNYDVVQETILD